MPMGDSAGRSSAHRVGQGAKRRNTERERQLVDPPTLKRVEDYVPGYTDPFLRHNTWVDYLAASVCVVLLAMVVVFLFLMATGS